MYIESNNNQKSNKSKLLSILILALIAALALLLWVYFSTRARLNNMINEKESQRIELKHELDSLIDNHNLIKIEYGNLVDSLRMKDSIITANADEIRHLLDTQYEYGKVLKKLNRLREISQTYVKQIDSLYVINAELKEENANIKLEFAKEQEITSSLKKDKEDLAKKVNSAAVLRAYNISAVGVKGSSDREKVTDKARNVEKIKICLTIGENPLLQAGRKDIYIRIARPDNKIISKGKGDEYSFKYNGEIMQYSIKEIINYQKEMTKLCTYWYNSSTDELLSGIYVVSVFSEDTEIGQATFELK